MSRFGIIGLIVELSHPDVKSVMTILTCIYLGAWSEGEGLIRCLEKKLSAAIFLLKGSLSSY